MKRPLYAWWCSLHKENKKSTFGGVPDLMASPCDNPDHKDAGFPELARVGLIQLELVGSFPALAREMITTISPEQAELQWFLLCHYHTQFPVAQSASSTQFLVVVD